MTTAAMAVLHLGLRLLLLIITMPRLAVSGLEQPNCFSILDQPQSSEAFVDEDPVAWQDILVMDADLGILGLQLANLSEHQPIVSCLTTQDEEGAGYSVSLQRLELGERWNVAGQRWLTVRQMLDANSTRLAFYYLIYQGSYRLALEGPCSGDRLTGCKHPTPGHERDSATHSTVVSLQQDSPLAVDMASCDPSVIKEPLTIHYETSSITFKFGYRPCHRSILPYESVHILLYGLREPELNTSMSPASRHHCFPDQRLPAHLLDQVEVSVEPIYTPHSAIPMASITYRSISLFEEGTYCVTAVSDNPACGWPESTKTPSFCLIHSDVIQLSKRPWIWELLPFCTSHFACGWLYVSVGGAAILLVSCVLSLMCVCCCCRRPSTHLKHHSVPADDKHTFDTLCLADLKPKKTWAEVHEEFYREPPKNPGKILLLYSPDSKMFKDLQVAFRGFLEEACHCVVLDFFDEDLFQSIAYNPEAWLSNLLKDSKFKIVIICSENAFKRQQALLKGEVLNIPDVHSSLDGLFSAGLRFIQAQHAYDYHRLALVRYEMLPLTAAQFTLQDMVPNREFLLPTQLHDLFCWIHDHDPLDLLGKPWDRYHLELQLLQDALKHARLERRPQL